MRRLRALHVGPAAFAATVLVACTEQPEEPTVASLDRQLVVIEGREWLAVGGAPVPPGTEIPSPPEPYNPTKHAPPSIKNLATQNLLAQTDYEAPPKRHFSPPGENRSSPEKRVRQMQGERGNAVWFIHSGAPDGIYAVHEVNEVYSINPIYPNASIYTSTEMPTGNACVEATTMHRNNNGFPSHEHGYYNHCSNPEQWITIEDMDPDWRHLYARPMGGELKFYIHIWRYASTGCWQGLIFNWVDMVWDAKTPQICGSGHSELGWSAWESYDFMEGMSDAGDCPNLMSIGNDAMGLRWDGEFWRPTRLETLPLTKDMSGVCFTSGFYGMDLMPPNGEADAWEATTPHPDEG